MIRKRSLLCGWEAIFSPNVCTKLAIQFLLCQLSRQHLAQPQRAQPSVHLSHLLLQPEGKTGANRRSATKHTHKNIHVHAHDGRRRSVIHNNFDHTYDIGTAFNCDPGDCEMIEKSNTFATTERLL